MLYKYYLFKFILLLLDVQENANDVVAEIVLEMWNMMKLKKFQFQNLEIRIVIVKENGNVVVLGIVNARRIVKKETTIAVISKIFILYYLFYKLLYVFFFIEAKIVGINMIKTILIVMIKSILNKNLLMVSLI